MEVARSQLSLEATGSPHLCPIAAKGECESWILRPSDCTSVSHSVFHSDPMLCDPMDYNLPGSSVHGILQTRILEWVAIPFSRGSSRPRNGTQVSCITGRFISVWATREAWLYKGNRKIQIFDRNLPHLKFCQFKKIFLKKHKNSQTNMSVDQAWHINFCLLSLL